MPPPKKRPLQTATQVMGSSRQGPPSRRQRTGWSTHPKSARAAQTLIIKAGGGEPGISVDLFLSSQVRVNTGDTLRWSWGWIEPHTVTFGRPTGDPTLPTHPAGQVIDFDGTQFISSGLTGGPTARIDIRFTTKGVYSYFCVIHPNMTGTLTVGG